MPLSIATVVEPQMLADFLDNFRSGFNYQARRQQNPGLTLSLYARQSFPDSFGFNSGRLAAGIMTDAVRQPWWAYNHPLGIAQMAGANLAKVPGMPEGYNQLGGTFLSLGVLPILSGNFDATNLAEFGRPAGYSALFPMPNDPTKTSNPLGEFVGRYFLGRRGNLLPYEQLIRELPSVTPEEYAQYKDTMGFRSKDFFGLQNNPVLPISMGMAVGAGVGYLNAKRKTRIELDYNPIGKKMFRGKDGSWQTAEYNPDNEVRVDYGAGVPDEYLEVADRYEKAEWLPEPPRDGTYGMAFGANREYKEVPIDDGIIIRGYNRFKRIAFPIVGAIAGGLAGSAIPTLANLGVLRSGTSIQGEPSIALMGYEVPLKAIAGTGLAATAMHYGLRNAIRPGQFDSPEVDRIFF